MVSSFAVLSSVRWMCYAQIFELIRPLPCGAIMNRNHPMRTERSATNGMIKAHNSLIKSSKTLFVVPTDSSSMNSVTRRDFLRASGVGVVAGTSGCMSALRDASELVRPHEHRSDAPVDRPSGPWPTFGATPGRTGVVSGVDLPPRDASIHEVTTIGLHPRAQPVVADGRAYIGVDRRTTDDDTFTGTIAIDLDAERPQTAVAWQMGETDPGAAVTPTVRGRVVFTQMGGMTALDTRDGSIYWRNAAAGGTPLPAPTVVDELCLAIGSGSVIALDAVTGAKRWTTESIISGAFTLAVAPDAVVVACGRGNEALYCFKRADGTTRWQQNAASKRYATVVTDGEQAYAVGTNGLVYAVGLEDGTTAWKYEFDGSSYTHAAVMDKTVYVAIDTQIAALDAVTGDPRWKRRIGVGGTASPTVTAGAVIQTTATRDGERLLILDPVDGTERRSYEIPPTNQIQPVVDDGTIYVVGYSRNQRGGSLYAIR